MSFAVSPKWLGDLKREITATWSGEGSFDCLGSARITTGEHSHGANQEYDDSEAQAGSPARIWEG